MYLSKLTKVSIYSRTKTKLPSILFPGKNIYFLVLYRLTLNSHKSLLSRNTAGYISDNNKHRICSKVYIDKNITLFKQPGTLERYILCPRCQQPTCDDQTVRVQWFSSAAFDMNEFLLLCLRHAWFIHHVLE